MITNKVRTTVKLNRNGVSKELKVTFDVIDRANTFVDWGSLPERLIKGQRPYTDMAKFVYFCLVEAGFDDVDIDDVYDEMKETDENGESYMLLCMQLAKAFVPQGKKKTVESEETTTPDQ